MSDFSSLPRIRLKPKADARALRHGAPWVYADDLVTDRRTKALTPGSVAILEDAERTPLGLAAVSPGSKIIARMLDRDLEARIDRDWFTARLGAALRLREQLYTTPYYRLVHAEGDGLPGLIIDRFGDTCVLQPNAAWLESRLEDLTAALQAVTGVRHILKSASGRTRKLEGLDDISLPLLGTPPDRVEVPMNGAIYIADLAAGQKTGLFYDQRPNHAFAAKMGRGGRVLDVFSHVGGFGLAALAAGAETALAVDGSAAALELAAEGAAAMGVADRFETRKSDAFAALEALNAEGAQFDLVVCDPPAFAPSKPALQQGLRAYERVARLAAPLVAPGGALMLCSCSHAAELPKFRSSCLRGIGRAGRSAQILYTGGAGPDHPLHAQLGETGYLKAILVRLLP
ncbi:RSP_2647 family RNA methyltransferase [Dinoroseobacter sp. S124A]|uniref:RSP_2647 family RNA methyltransferase n=1 Tax=Dinoroseobacter sp. S124A TaxID=3415128 RepID=UPI003C7D7CC3